MLLNICVPLHNPAKSLNENVNPGFARQATYHLKTYQDTWHNRALQLWAQKVLHLLHNVPSIQSPTSLAADDLTDKYIKYENVYKRIQTLLSFFHPIV